MPAHNEPLTRANLQACGGVWAYITDNHHHHLGIPYGFREDEALERAETARYLLDCGLPVPTFADENEYGDLVDEYPEDDDYSGSDYDENVIHSYSFTPDWRMNGDGPVFMGAEIEIENERGDISTTAGARLAVECLSRDGGHEYHGFVKDDGSLSDGLEIVTHPMTYAYAAESFPWDMLTQLHRAGFRAARSCGLHIHVSRSAFDNPQHIYRWLKFIYRNPTPIQTLARRGSVNYSSWSEPVRMAAKEHAKGSFEAPRYVAVNVQNVNTLEVRLFRSSLSPQTVKASFAFVESSVEYTRTLTCHDIARNDGWSWKAYFAYVEKAGNRWTDLMAEASRRFRGREMPQDTITARNHRHNPWGTYVDPWGVVQPRSGPVRPRETTARETVRETATARIRRMTNEREAQMRTMATDPGPTLQRDRVWDAFDLLNPPPQYDATVSDDAAVNIDDIF
jgi:hypothetical protein